MKKVISNRQILQNSKILILLSLLGLVSCEKEKVSSALPPTTVEPLKKVNSSTGQIIKSDEAPVDKLEQLILENTHQPDLLKKEEAIKIAKQLGSQKREDAVQTLLDGMMVIRPFEKPAGTGALGAFPCLEALVAIGPPAVPKIEDKFFSTLIPMEQFLLFQTLLDIKGSEATSTWLDQLPDNGPRSLPPAKKSQLREFALSLEKAGQGVFASPNAAP